MDALEYFDKVSVENIIYARYKWIEFNCMYLFVFESTYFLEELSLKLNLNAR